MYRTTYSWSITPLGNIDEWESQSKVDLVAPIRLRDPGRPCVRRKKSWMEKNKQTKPRHCSTCGSGDHNSRTCQGGPVGSNPKKKRVRTEILVDGDTIVVGTIDTKKIRKNSASKSASATASSSKSVAADRATSTSAAVAGSKRKANGTAAAAPSTFVPKATSAAGSQRKANGTAAPSTSAAKVTSAAGSKRKAKGTAPSTSAAPSSSVAKATSVVAPSTSVSKKVTTAPTTSAAGGAGSSLVAGLFSQTYHGTVNIQNQTNNICEPSSKRQRNPNSKYV
ncbi:hypothetical protein MKW98_019541 [Papaver atlanticum]|uniref:Uncharacterized protein n=1 Tax=Papaver atlanticum TaxID=357466 RepID=A0AAD4S8I3_9MAGN|nr:hypothetical protein MKW98_019541 [Papaver atlanticum]